MLQQNERLFIEIMNFETDVQEAIGHYVYALIDPRNGKTFYIGRGIKNRVFDHGLEALKKYNEISGDIAENQDLEEGENEKIKKINEIRKENFEVIYFIHRYIPFGKNAGRTEEEAKTISKEVEATLIAMHDGLTNVQDGYESDRSPQNINILIKKLSVKPIQEFKSKVMIISINKSYKTSISIYEAVRRSWTASKKSAEECDLVLAERCGVCVGVFKPSAWFTSKENPKRIEFEGVEAEKEIADLYYNKRTPEKKKGAMLPFRYFDESFNYEEHLKSFTK